DESAWNAYIKLEKRYQEIERAREIYERFVHVHPEPKNWTKWAKFEEDQNNIDKVREIFSEAIEYLGDDHIDQRIFITFAKFETRLKEFERARVIYKYALDRMPRHKSETLYKQYTQFEKQYGDKEDIEDVVIGKRRTQYEEEIKNNPKNYDVWFDYARLEEDNGDVTRTREVYERAIAEVPPVQEKRFWKRYIYLWIKYALFEELETKDYERARQVYSECIKLIPHKKFTFAKIWLFYAYFEIRRLNLDAARKTLGTSIGMCPKDKLFKGYIELEIQLLDFDRVRKLYEKHMEYNPANCYAWIKFAEVEKELEDYDRCRAIFELAIQQPVLDMPEVLWKAYIDFEMEQEEYDKARMLYERLLERTQHVKVWISFAQFELQAPNIDSEDSGEKAARARQIFDRAYKSMKERELKEERVLILEAWREFETQYGTSETLESVTSKMPKVVKKRRQVEDEVSGTSWEEYYDYIFPDDVTQKPNLKFLAMAYQWSQSRQGEANNESEVKEEVKQETTEEVKEPVTEQE
ncbi:NineTeen Complex (NTC) component, partial [Basidiobolus ranarum]